MLHPRQLPNSAPETRVTNAGESPPWGSYTLSWDNLLGLSLERKEV